MFLRRSTTAFVLLLAVGLTAVTAAVGAPPATQRVHVTAQRARATTARAHVATRRKTVLVYARRIEKFRTRTRYWQRVMGVPTSAVRVRTLQAVSVARIRHLARLWRRRLTRASRSAHNPPHLRAWLCIHHYEGSWTDSGAPYYGGLQMSYTFQQTYGGWLLRSKGTANHWSPLEQIWTAVRAHRTRGFAPWPNTARICGLI